MKCPKCNIPSGDNWSQCGGSCPMPMSPHYREADDSRRRALIEVKGIVDSYVADQLTSSRNPLSVVCEIANRIRVLIREAK